MAKAREKLALRRCSFMTLVSNVLLSGIGAATAYVGFWLGASRPASANERVTVEHAGQFSVTRLYVRDCTAYLVVDRLIYSFTMPNRQFGNMTCFRAGSLKTVFVFAGHMWAQKDIFPWENGNEEVEFMGSYSECSGNWDPNPIWLSGRTVLGFQGLDGKPVVIYFGPGKAR